MYCSTGMGIFDNPDKYKNETIENLKSYFSVDEAVNTILRMQSKNIQRAIQKNMIPKEAGQIDVILNDKHSSTSDDIYMVRIKGNGVGLSKSEAEAKISDIDNLTTKWPIALFKLSGVKYIMESNDRQSDEMFRCMCSTNDLNFTERDELHKVTSENCVDHFGCGFLFSLDSEYSVSDIGSAFRDQSQNIDIRVAYEFQTSDNTIKRMYPNR